MTSKIQILLAAAFAGTLALAPVALAGDDNPGSKGPAGRAARAEGGRHMGGKFLRRHRAMRLLRALDLSDGQKTALQEARTAAEPIRKDTHEKLRALFQDVRKGDRTPEARAKAREQAKALIGAARTQVEPAAQRILASLTAEQRAKLSEIAAKHGKTIDDARLLKGIERLLLMPDRRLNR